MITYYDLLRSGYEKVNETEPYNPSTYLRTILLAEDTSALTSFGYGAELRDRFHSI